MQRLSYLYEEEDLAGDMYGVVTGAFFPGHHLDRWLFTRIGVSQPCPPTCDLGTLA